MSERNAGGKFAQGNTAAVGHGRPGLPTERHFLRRVAERLNAGVFDQALTAWAGAVQAGERWAVELAFKYALGNEPASLLDLATDEANGISPDVFAQAHAEHAAAGSGDETAQLLMEVSGISARSRMLELARTQAGTDTKRRD